MTTEVTGKFHPLANAFPLLEGDAFAELVDDIRAHGLNDPVIMYEGKILDGRNRWRACQFLEIPHREKQFTGEDPAAFVWSSNAIRRQLTPAQRSIAAAKLANATEGRPRKFAPGGDVPVTISDAAKLAKVGARTIARAKKVIENADPRVVKAVEDGELALAPAERLAEKPKEEQAEILRTVPVEKIPAVVPDRRRTPSIPGGFREPVHDPSESHDRDLLVRQMRMPEITFLRKVWKDWEIRKDVIPELDQDDLYDFADRLRKTRADLTRLVNLIEEAKSEAE